MNEEKVEFIITLLLVILFIVPVIGVVLWENDADTPDKENIKQCTNLKKFYKDDIVFDNFYVACDEPINLEVSPELYTRLVDGENYKITFNKLGGIYLIEKVEDK